MYYELGQASMMESFRKTNWRLLVVNYFRKNAPSKMLDRVLNTRLSYSFKDILFNVQKVLAQFVLKDSKLYLCQSLKFRLFLMVLL